jgi:hypothetical protein
MSFNIPGTHDSLKIFNFLLIFFSITYYEATVEYTITKVTTVEKKAKIFNT